MPNITMYTTAICPYCVAAKNFLKSRGASWEEVRIDLDPAARVVTILCDRAERYYSTKLFKQQRLALHDGHCALWTDVAKSEHRGSVAHDGNGVLTNGVLM